MLAGTDEAPGEIIVENGRSYKHFRGMASFDAQKASGRNRPRVEGISAKIPYKGTVVNILRNIDDGLCSAFSYSGAKNLHEFHAKSRFVRVTSNTVKENHPHIHHPYQL
jgi:IMP dehydrogenase